MLISSVTALCGEQRNAGYGFSHLPRLLAWSLEADFFSWHCSEKDQVKLNYFAQIISVLFYIIIHPNLSLFFCLSYYSGGLSNWLYHVSLPGGEQASRGNEPSQVLLRLYGEIHGDEQGVEGLITESVIFTLLSERKLGPRLHGVFPGGRIEEYIPVSYHTCIHKKLCWYKSVYWEIISCSLWWATRCSPCTNPPRPLLQARPLKTAELADPKLSPMIAEKMAEIHSMNVPISKEPNWLWDTMNRWVFHPPLQNILGLGVYQFFIYIYPYRWLQNVMVTLRDPAPHTNSQNAHIISHLVKVDLAAEVKWIK